MEISIADQIALDDALVAPADRLKIGKCNLRLSSDITSKEATLQGVYDVLKLTPFYKAFQVTADAPEIYMQEFWATAYFEEPPLEKEILPFLASLGHSREIKKITDVNVNKMHQPWRSFAAIINKCLSGKPSYDSLRLSQAQILWGMYNKKKVDYAYLPWEDFTYQIENKNTKKGNAMYYPRFTKLVVNFVISRNETLSLRVKRPVALTNEDIRNSESYKEYYAIASGKIPLKTKGSKKKADTDAITKQKPPTVPKEKKEKTSRKGKQKAKDGSGVDEGTGVTPGVPDAPDYDSDTEISWKSSDDIQDDEKAQDNEDEDKNDENETTHDDEDDDISSSDDEDSDNEIEGTNVEGAKSDEDATYEEDQGNEAVKDTNTNLEGRDDVMTDVILPQVQATQEIEDTHVTLTPVNPDGQQQSSSVSSGFVSNMLNPNQDTGVDAIFGQQAEATSLIEIPVTTIVEPSFFVPTNRPPTPNPLFIRLQQPPILTPATTPSSSLQNLPDFGSLFGFDYRLKALEDNFSELRQTNQYAEALSSIPGIVDHYLANKMQEAVDVAVQLKYDKIREESHTENQQFLDSIDEGMKKVIKEQVKKEVSKITPKIEKLVNEQLESEVLVRSSKEAKTSHAVAANLSELELKKILIDKMEANNSINRSDIQRQLYKALVDAYEADKILLDTYGDTVTIKRPRDGADDDQEPSAGTDRGSKRRRSGKEPESTSAPREMTTTTAGKTTTGSKTHKQSASQSAPVEDTMQTTDVFEAPAHQEFETGVHDEQAEEEVHHLPDWFQQPKRLPSPDHAWNKSVPAVHESVQPWLSNLEKDRPSDSISLQSHNKKELDWINPEGRKYPHDLRKPLPLVPNSHGRHVITIYTSSSIMYLEYLRGGEVKPESTRQIRTLGNSHGGKSEDNSIHLRSQGNAALTSTQREDKRCRRKVEIVEWQNYKHLDWITVRRDDDILYKFKEGDFHRLRIQDIEDMLLLLVQGKLTNLNVEERIAFNVSLRMFTRSVVIQRRVEDLQLGVESYQKKLNLTKPDTYKSNLRRKDAYTPYSDPRGFIYENKDKKNRLMRIDELHKFSDGTVDDVRTALNDRLKGIRMEYLPQTFWSQRDKVNARAMIQAIDKRLKTRRIFWSLERFVGGRPYGNDLWLLQRTI
ncbi:hypothetical protein Tco_1041691 [Tanacetum coccineum]|uniref:Uncharacterized protein n=1 Tax=Tanacetum coccineum TaxID=301880 RepID=A0ABQ5GID4_9ASTR